MKEFGKIETKIGYEDPKMVVSISIDKGSMISLYLFITSFTESKANWISC